MPWVERTPWPYTGTVRHFRDIQMGIPEAISSRITPSDHISYDQAFYAP